MLTDNYTAEGSSKYRKAQSSLELCMLVIIIAAALMAMAVYTKRSLQGRFRTAADSIGEQYSPALSTSSLTISSNSLTTSEVKIENPGRTDARSVTTTNSQDTVTREGSDNVGELQDEKMF